ncbi:MAG: ferritin-like fold-containing protein [Microbacterium sp.]|uniref:ferritin-like fold-containing protein n=1 Tax=Microbacterium sp. TaxID=51671 RepID=UPI003A8C5745
MVTWFWQRRKTRTARSPLQLRARGERGDATRVDFAELAPDVDTFLGQAAYLQLSYFETLSELIASRPELGEKEALSRAAGAALTKHEGLVALIRERDGDPTALMEPFREELDAFRAATHGVRPEETMLSVHITAGMLDDFYYALATSYADTGRRVARILQADDDRQAIVELLRAAVTADAEWRALLALWGRRLVGDTLLVARSALRGADDLPLDAAEQKQVEPVFTELMGAHARRMDALGLSA